MLKRRGISISVDNLGRIVPRVSPFVPKLNLMSNSLCQISLSPYRDHKSDSTSSYYFLAFHINISARACIFQSHEDTSNVLPLLRDDEADQRQHRHGVTIRPTSRCTNISRAKSAASTYTSYSGQKVDGELKLPKTFLTRKGALLLFSSPDPDQELSEKEKDYLQHARKLLKHRYKDYCSKLGGSVDRLVQSILMFGDQVSRLFTIISFKAVS